MKRKKGWLAAAIGKIKNAYSVLAVHRYTTIAGTLVFFLILSIVPLLFLVTLLFGRAALSFTVEDTIFSWAEELLVFLRENAAQANGGVGVFFFLTTLWSSTGFFYHLRRSGEMIYDYRRAKHGWKVRLSALLFTLCVLLFFALAGGILIVSNILMRFLSPYIFYPAFVLILLVLGFFGAWILNAYVCPFHTAPSDTALGSFFTAILWLLASCAFAVYLRYASYEKLYGALSLLVVFLLWLYWMMICFVVGVIYSRVKLHGKALSHKKL